MKNILYVWMTAAISVAFAACSSGSSVEKSTELTPANYSDSLSYYMGGVHGDYVASMLAEMPESITSKIDREKFMEGFRAALMIDAKHVAQMYGVHHGVSLWSQNQIMKNAGVDVNYDMMLSGFAAGLEMDTTRTAEMERVDSVVLDLVSDVNLKIMAYQQGQQAKAEAALKAAGEKNLAAGEEFIKTRLEADKTLKTTKSGLVYKEVEAGRGAKPTDKSLVMVRYTGYLVDGTIFDTSYEDAVQFAVADVVPGFREALKMMRKGAKYQIIIPSDLGYGLQAPPMIGPNSTLVFDLELVDIE